MEDQGFRSLLTRIKHLHMDKLLMILLTGILLLIICIPTKKSHISGAETVGEENGLLAGRAGICLTDSDDGRESEEGVEQKLKELLQKIDGVGQVDVMIMRNSEYNQIEGVVVVAEGADVPSARQEITETVQALFPIAAYKVKVCKMAGGKK